MDYIVIIFIILLVLNFGFIVWGVSDLLRRENVRILSKKGWLFLMVLVFYSSVFYLLFGRGEDKRQKVDE